MGDYRAISYYYAYILVIGAKMLRILSFFNGFNKLILNAKHLNGILIDCLRNDSKNLL